MKLLKLFSVLTLFIAISLTSCSGEDGTDGIDGINGENGTNGQDGTNGLDGSNGQGFDELTQYGYITLEMDGTRPDNVTLQDSTSFRFVGLAPEFLQDGTRVISSIEGDNTVHIFSIYRFLSAPDDAYQESFMAMAIQVINLGEESQTINLFQGTINNYAVIGDDNKFFGLTQNFDKDNVGTKDFEVSNLSFDTATNHLTLSYSFTIDSESNVTDHDLTMSGDIDVFLLEIVE